MLSLLSALTLAQIPQTSIDAFYFPAPEPQETIVQPQEIRVLPGHLDEIPVFNSNSPEVIYSAGILLSTFPPDGMIAPLAHLNLPLRGRFDIFSHHIARGRTRADWLPKYHALLIRNPNDYPVVMNILQGVSYVTNPDAPFIDLPPVMDNRAGTVFSGPGSRLAGDVLRGVDEEEFPDRLILEPGESKILFNLPIHLGNARSTLVKVETTGAVYMASLAMPAIQRGDRRAHRPPTLKEWEKLLTQGYLAFPRDRPPTPLEETRREVIYGRVAGVARGSQWHTKIVDEGGSHLSIPSPGEAFSYPISTVHAGTLGTGQIQSAPMLVRYPDTAYLAHGNYGVHYQFTLPLKNNGDRHKTVTLALQTPLKHDREVGELEFLEPPNDRVFFRGSVRVRYKDEIGLLREQFFHLVQRQGEQGEPLVTLNLKPGMTRDVTVELLYPPDATPPQVLTVSTEDNILQVNKELEEKSESNFE
ncbi:MAG: DUF3370 domain-containing protein [Spirulina sp.]